MRLRPRSCPFRTNPLLSFTILFIALFYLGTDLRYHNWTKTESKDRGVIHWDIISYYAYLPATFIYGDVTLGFLDDPPEGFINDNKFWFFEMEDGKRLIITSMGMSVLYSPFFFMAHGLAPLFGQVRDGYSSIYQFFLVIGSLVYVILGLVILKNLLLRFFSTRTTFWTLLAIALGTNFYFYSTHEAPMAHASSFFLIVLFLWMVILWYKKQSILNTLLTGALLGFIALVRPTNILVLIILLLYDVKTLRELWQRIGFFLRNFHLVLILLAGFIMAWMPQFLYWHAITGQFIFYSYGPHGGKFFWAHPHILENLFSYKKGWFVYVPLMFLAVAGIPILKKRIKSMFWLVVVLLLFMIYVQSSWWCWWFGGCYGNRSYVEIFGILAFPLAATIDYAFKDRRAWIGKGYVSIIALLILFHQLNTYQYKKGIIHYKGMNKEVYWKSFLRLKRPEGYSQSLTLPDYDLARKGIYVFYHTGAKYDHLKEMEPGEAVKQLEENIRKNRRQFAEVKRYAKRMEISVDHAVMEVSERMYDQITNHIEYDK